MSNSAEDLDEDLEESKSNNNNDEQSWVLDSLVGFLKSPLWSSSLHNFIDQMSIVFEPDDIEDNEGNVEDRAEYQTVFKDYRALVDQLITSHMTELGISEQQFASACQLAEGMLADKLKQMLFEELWAAENYEVFVRLMARRNVELQLEALDILAQRYGLVYDVFVPFGTSPQHFLSEEHVMREAILRSLNDLELNDSEELSDNKKYPPIKYTTSKQMMKTNEGVDKDDNLTLSNNKDTNEASVEENAVQQDKARLEAVKQKANRKMREALRSAISNERGVRFVDNDEDDDGQTSAEKTEPEETCLIGNEPNAEQEHDKVDGATTSTAVPPSVVEADNNDNNDPSADSGATTTMNMEDIKRRADYLREQRDKIIELRQKERSEFISKYLTKQKVKVERPKTARRESSVASGSSTIGSVSNVEHKSDQSGSTRDLAYRKTLAARLKAEVINRE